MKYRFALLAAAGVMALGTASAQDGYYGTIGLGYAFEKGENDFESDGNAFPTEFDTELDTDGAIAVFGALGKYFDYGLRGEVELSYRNQDVTALPGDGGFFAGFPNGGDDLGEIGVTALMANVYYDFALTEAISPYIGVGVGVAKVALDFDNVAATAAATTPADANTGYRIYAKNDDYVPAAQGRAGVNFMISENVSFDLGYRYLQTAEYDTEAYVNNPVADVQGTYKVHEATFGLRFAFGGDAAPVYTPVAADPTPVQPSTKTCLDGTVVAANAPCPVAEEDELTPAELRTVVYFEFDRADLSPSAMSLLQRRAGEASDVDLMEVVVAGNTDTSGSASYNQRLSARRAAVVRDALVRFGVDADKIKVRALGESNLAKPTADGVREPLNRRTEVEFDF